MNATTAIAILALAWAAGYPLRRAGHTTPATWVTLSAAAGLTAAAYASPATTTPTAATIPLLAVAIIAACAAHAAYWAATKQGAHTQ